MPPLPSAWLFFLGSPVLVSTTSLRLDSSESATLNNFLILFPHALEVFFFELRSEGIKPRLEVEELLALLVGLLRRVEPDFDCRGAFVLLHAVQIRIEQLHGPAVFLFDSLGRPHEDVWVDVLDEVLQNALRLEAAFESEAPEESVGRGLEERANHPSIELLAASLASYILS